MQEHTPLQKLLDKSKIFTSNLQSEIAVALKTAFGDPHKKVKSLEVCMYVVLCLGVVLIQGVPDKARASLFHTIIPYGV